MNVTVYTTPNCSMCQATKRHMDRKGIAYEVVDLSEHPDKLREFIDQGLNQAPIVVAGDEVWSGYRHEKIEHIATMTKVEEAHGA